MDISHVADLHHDLASTLLVVNKRSNPDHDLDDVGAKKKGRKKSQIWENVRVDDENRVVCRHCNQVIRVKYGEKVERLRRHFIKSCTHSPFPKDSKEYAELVDSLATPSEPRRRTSIAPAPKTNDRGVTFTVTQVHNIINEAHHQLTPDQIMKLEAQGNRCANGDWDQVRLLNVTDVTHEHSLDMIRGCNFSGSIFIGSFLKHVTTDSGVSLPPGLYNSNFSGTVVLSDNCHVSNCAMVSNTYVGRNSCLINCGTFSCDGNCSFGTQRVICIGSEASIPSFGQSRSIPLNINLTYSDVCDRVINFRGVEATENPRLGMEADHVSRIKRFSLGAKFSSSFSGFSGSREGSKFYLNVIGEDVEVKNCTSIRNVFIGPNSQVDNSSLMNCLLLARCTANSSELVDVVMNNSCAVTGRCTVDGVLMYAHSYIADGAIVKESIIGPDASISIGECRRSLIGPFVGFHHQALVISTIWPMGRGNVAYGAKLGANHTSRTNSMECIPGEGCFFGLDCSLQLPVNLTNSPYSIIASGTKVQSQVLEFPFSLICESRGVITNARHSGKTYGIIRPGWVLTSNMYFLERSALKCIKRRKSAEYRTDLYIFRPSIIEMVSTSLSRLLEIKRRVDHGEVMVEYKNVEDGSECFYVDQTQIAGSGSSLVPIVDLNAAILAYSNVRKRYALHGLVYMLFANDVDFMANDLNDDTRVMTRDDSDSEDEMTNPLLPHLPPRVRTETIRVDNINDDVKLMEGTTNSLSDMVLRQDKRSSDKRYNIAGLHHNLTPFGTMTERTDMLLRKFANYFIADSHLIQVRKHQFKILLQEYPELNGTEFLAFVDLLPKKNFEIGATTTNSPLAYKLRELLIKFIELEREVAQNVHNGYTRDINRSHLVIPSHVQKDEEDEVTYHASKRHTEAIDCVNTLLKMMHLEALE